MLDGSEPGWHYAVQANPIVADGTLYIATPANAIVALDAASGEVRWEYRTPQRPAHRGLVYWPGDGTIPPRLYFPEGRNLVALDARTGELDPSFGESGRSPIGRATAAPARPAIAAGAFRAASATASPSKSAWPSSPPPPSARPSKPSIAQATPSPSKPRAATIPVCCHARSPWWRP